MSYVWEFTNKRKLTEKEFKDYLERKVFRTIRKYGMLPKDRPILIEDSKDINAKVLRKILEKKFKVKYSKNPHFSTKNLGSVSEEILRNVISGKFIGPLPNGKEKIPLYRVLDEEVDLYAKLCGIKGRKRKKDKKVQELFAKFKKKNPDLEMNIINAFLQLPHQSS